MARRIRAGRLIFNGGDDSEDAMAAAIAVDPEAVGALEPGESLRLGMAAVTSLSGFIHDMILLAYIRGVGNPAVLVEDANLFDPRLSRDGLNGVIQAVSVVAQHVFTGAALDGIADALGGLKRVLLQMLAV